MKSFHKGIKALCEELKIFSPLSAIPSKWNHAYQQLDAVAWKNSKNALTDVKVPRKEMRFYAK
jgi:hypothetical protein